MSRKKPQHSKNWGGRREGAGRKAGTFRERWSEEELKRMRASLRTAEKVHGKKVWDILTGMAFGTDKRTAVQAMAMLKDAFIVRETKQHKEVSFHAPVTLPVMDEDPARLDESAEPVRISGTRQ